MTHTIVRTVLDLTFTNTSQLRIGAGDEGGIFRDYQQNPYIPSTSLKGAARALLERAGGAAANELFGTIKHSETKSGQIGKVVFSGAVAKAGASTPNENEIRLTRRTAINKAKGVAEHNKLFDQESVRPDTSWTARLTIDGSLSGDGLKTLQQLLARWRTDGLPIGRNTGDGDGVLVLKGVTGGTIIDRDIAKLEVQHRPLSDTEKATWFPKETAEPLTESGPTWTLTLTCDGPFAVLAGDDTNTPRAEGQRGNELKALRDKDGNPTLPGSSFMGALRSKAEWLEALDHLRAGTANQKALTQAIFGTEAKAGTLLVDSIKSTRPTATKKLTSVKIDRFTQGTIEGALFTVEAFIDPVFVVKLRLSHRKSVDDEKFVQRLIQKLTTVGPSNGLELGHASNRGFGWFGVNVETKGGV